MELEDRVSFAKSKNADLFVSIHNNSIGNSGVHGATVYYPNSNYNANIGNQGANVAGKFLIDLWHLDLPMRVPESEIQSPEINMRMVHCATITV